MFYTAQPDFPTELPTQDGYYLAYLEVWQRDISAAEEPNIREPALGGVDTTVRIKTLAQTKLLPLIKPLENLNNPTYDSFFTPKNGDTEEVREKINQNIANWRKLTQLSSGQLKPYIRAEAGLANQFYRLEVHQAGNLGSDGNIPIFKWSKNNATINARIINVNGNNITIDKILYDDEDIGFAVDRWIEISTYDYELTGRSGLLVKITGVQDNVISTNDWQKPNDEEFAKFVTALQSDGFIRRWDSGPMEAVVDTGGLYSLVLENGLELRLSPGDYKTGDYWTLATRSPNSIDWPFDQNGFLLESVHGIQRHCARLALVNLNEGQWTSLQDCRQIFQSLVGVKDISTLVNSGGTTPMVIVTEAGKVGVGTATPVTELQVIGTTTINNLNTTGSIIVDNNITASGKLAVGAAVISNGSALQVTGNIATTDLNANNTIFGKDITASNSLNTKNLTASGTVAVTGAVSAGSFTTNSSINTATLTTTGLINAANISTAGNVVLSSTSSKLVVGTSTVNSSGEALQVSGKISSTDTINTPSLTATGTVSAANLSATGNVVLSSSNSKLVVGTSTVNSTGAALQVSGKISSTDTINTPAVAATGTISAANLTATGAVNAGSFTTSGNLTLNTTNSKLVVGTGTVNASGAALQVTGEISATGNTIIDGQLGIGTTTLKNKLDVEGGAAIGSPYSGNHSAPEDGLIVSGKVGLGTVNPINKLDVIGSMTVGASKTAPTNGLKVGGTTRLDGSTAIGFADNDLLRSRLEVKGGVVIGPNYAGTTDAVSDSLVIEGSLAVGVKIPKNKVDVAGNVAIGTSYAANATAAPSNSLVVEGSLGIGTLTPKNKLGVSGAAAIGSSYAANAMEAPSNSLVVEGSLGIGTLAPKNKLGVSGAAAIGSSYAASSTAAPSNGLLVQGSVGIGTLNPKNTVDIAGSLSVGNYATTAPDNSLIISGNLGAGNSNPDAKLTVGTVVSVASPITVPTTNSNSNKLLKIGSIDGICPYYIRGIGSTAYITTAADATTYVTNFIKVGNISISDTSLLTGNSTGDLIYGGLYFVVINKDNYEVVSNRLYKTATDTTAASALATALSVSNFLQNHLGILVSFGKWEEHIHMGNLTTAINSTGLIALKQAIEFRTSTTANINNVRGRPYAAIFDGNDLIRALPSSGNAYPDNQKRAKEYLRNNFTQLHSQGGTAPAFSGPVHYPAILAGWLIEGCLPDAPYPRSDYLS